MNGSQSEGPERSTKKPPWLNKMGGRAADAGWTMSGSVIGCLLLGYLIGEGLDANPVSTVVGLFIGLGVGLYNLARVMGLIR